MGTKSQLISDLKQEVTDLQNSPLYSYRVKNHYLPVVGEGNLDAQLMFVGEAPGEKEALSGQPFVGAAGRVLNSLLESVGLSRSDVYITSILLDRPPGNRDPLPREIEIYAPFLDRQVQIIRPSVIVTLGRFSTAYLMNQFGLADQLRPISQIHGQVFPVVTEYGQVQLVPQYHPAVALYRAPMKTALLEDFQTLAKLVTGSQQN